MLTGDDLYSIYPFSYILMILLKNAGDPWFIQLKHIPSSFSLERNWGS
jgi:hypothetical protein